MLPSSLYTANTPLGGYCTILEDIALSSLVDNYRAKDVISAVLSKGLRIERNSTFLEFVEDLSKRTTAATEAAIENTDKLETTTSKLCCKSF